jgi:hypothetical protein
MTRLLVERGGKRQTRREPLLSHLFLRFTIRRFLSISKPPFSGFWRNGLP